MPKMTRGVVIRGCAITRLSRARMDESRRKDDVDQALTNGPAPGFRKPSRPATGSSHVGRDSSLFGIFRPRDERSDPGLAFEDQRSQRRQLQRNGLSKTMRRDRLAVDAADAHS